VGANAAPGSHEGEREEGAGAQGAAHTGGHQPGATESAGVCGRGQVPEGKRRGIEGKREGVDVDVEKYQKVGELVGEGGCGRGEVPEGKSGRRGGGVGGG